MLEMLPLITQFSTLYGNTSNNHLDYRFRIKYNTTLSLNIVRSNTVHINIISDERDAGLHILLLKKIIFNYIKNVTIQRTVGWIIRHGGIQPTTNWWPDTKGHNCIWLMATYPSPTVKNKASPRKRQLRVGSHRSNTWDTLHKWKN